MQEHLETLKWFEQFYNKNKKLIDIILSDNKNKMIEYEILDFWKMLQGKGETIKVYRIKGFTKFNWNELMRCGTTLEIASLKGKPHLVYCYSNFNPEIRIQNNKEYLTEYTLKRLRELFKRLIINLEYYKKYKGE